MPILIALCINMNALIDLVDLIDEYDNTLARAPNDIRDDLRRRYELPATAQMVREDVEEMGQSDLEAHIEDIYFTWSQGRPVPLYYQYLLNSQEQMDNVTDRIEQVIVNIENQVHVHNRAFRPVNVNVANTFINTPDFGFDQENIPPN